MRPRTISVLGCGWLGFPLAMALVRAGHRVQGSSTSQEKLAQLAEAGVEPHRIVLEEASEGSHGDFFASDILIATVPPSGSESAYPELMRTVRHLAETRGARWLLMTSSTSVYPNLDRVVTESDAGEKEGRPLSRRGAEVLAAERVLFDSSRFDTSVLRLAGLYGYERHPARSLAGRCGLAGSDAPVNLVHRDDVIGAVLTVIDRDARGGTFNVCADEHPARRQLYPAVAERLGLEPPTFAEGSATGFKIVSNRRLKEQLGYELQYPDPMRPAP